MNESIANHQRIKKLLPSLCSAFGAPPKIFLTAHIHAAVQRYLHNLALFQLRPSCLGITSYP